MKILITFLFTIVYSVLLSQHFAYHNSFDGAYNSQNNDDLYGEGELHISELNDDKYLFEIFIIDNADTLLKGKVIEGLVKDVYLVEYKLLNRMPSIACIWFENNDGIPVPSLSRYPRLENDPVSAYTRKSEGTFSFTEVVVSNDKNGLPKELETIDWTRDQDRCFKKFKVIRIKHLDETTVIGAIASDNLESFKEPYTIFLAENIVYDQEMEVTMWYTAMDNKKATMKMTFKSSQYEEGVSRIIYKGDDFRVAECR